MPVNVKTKGIHANWEYERCLMESVMRESMVVLDSMSYGMAPSSGSSIKTMLRNARVGYEDYLILGNLERKVKYDDNLR